MVLRSPSKIHGGRRTRPWLRLCHSHPRSTEARGRGARKIVLNARDNAAEFDRKHGYEIIGDAGTLFGVIRHARMAKVLL